MAESEKAYTGWPEDFPEVTSLVSYSALRHNPDPALQALYDRAKNHEDQEAAAELIDRLVRREGVENVLSGIKTLASRHPGAVLVSVHAIEGRGRNAIPHMLARFIAEQTNLEVDNTIVQTGIVSKTGAKSTWYRLAHRAQFEGTVRAGKDYILVDDVFSAGGTFSELRQFIERNGGRAVDAVTMANGAKSMIADLAVTKQHLLELERKFGVESVQHFLKEESLYGGNHKALTDAEARTILGAASLDEARDRMAEARQERDRRVRPEVVPGTSPDPKEVKNTPYSTLSTEKTIPPEIAERINRYRLPPREGDSPQTPRVSGKAFRHLNDGKPYFGDILSFTLKHDRLPTDEEIERMPKQGDPALYAAEQNTRKEKKSMTIDELFDQARENGYSRYLTESDPDEITNGDVYLNTHTLCTAEGSADIEDFSLFKSPGIERTDFSSSPFWVITSYQGAIPVKDANDFIKLYGNDFDIAAYLRDENWNPDVTAWDGSLDSEAARERIEALRRGEGIETGPRNQNPEFNPGVPEEKAFLAVLHQRKVITEAVKNGTLSCLPGADGYADTEPAVNLVNGTRYHGANLLMLKEFQREKGFPTAEFVTRDAMEKSGIPIRKGEHGVEISFSVKNEESGEWEHRTANLFNAAQSAKPWELKTWAAAQVEEQVEEKQNFLKNQFGESYRPREQARRGPGPEITCTSTEPEKYLGQYLAAVSMGGKFKVTPGQAAEFGKNLEAALYAKMENGHSNPFKLTKLCGAAGEHCKAVIREFRKEQRAEQARQQEARGYGL